MKILFLVPYPLNKAPSQRFRFEQYFSYLDGAGFIWNVQSFMDEKAWTRAYTDGKSLYKIMDIIAGFCRRLISLFIAPQYDVIFVHREMSPIGPPVFEWLISHILNKRIIYDFDDAIWLTDLKDEQRFIKILKWRRKVRSICKWAHKISCGNEYLMAYAKQFNRKVVYNPTTIDIKNAHNRDLYPDIKDHGNAVVIGWTGSHSTLKYLSEIEDVLRRIEVKYPHARILVIADVKPALRLKSVDFTPWSVEREIEDLLRIDIGLMPLPHDEWTKGKCGFKALQYMSLNRPVIASPVGVSSIIIENGINGFLADGPGDWEKSLSLLIEDSFTRKAMGEKGRAKVVSDYSVVSNSSNFLSLFE